MSAFEKAPFTGQSVLFDTHQPQSGSRIVRELTSDEWDELIVHFEDALYEQVSKFQVAIWGESRVRRIAIIRNGQIVSMALGLVFMVPFLNRGLALVKFAPLWRRKGVPPDREVLSYAIDALIEQFVVRDKLSLSIIPAADPRFAGDYQEQLLAKGFRHRPIRESERFLVNATLSSDRQLASLNGTWRSNLKKALKEGLVVAAEDSEQALSDFADLFAEMEKRKNYSNASWAAFREALASGCPGSVRPTLFLVRDAGRAVAGAIVVQMGDTAYYLFGATNERGVQLRAGYTLHWWIRGWLHERQVHWYDLGGGTREDGLMQFKKGFAGKEGATEAMPGEFTLAQDPISALLAVSLLTIRRTRLLMRSRLYKWKQDVMTLLHLRKQK